MRRDSISTTAPWTMGSPKIFARREIETNSCVFTWIVPSGRRTAVATLPGERIITPSMTACPPMGEWRSGIGNGVPGGRRKD